VDGNARQRFCPFFVLCFFSVFLLLPVYVSFSSVSSSSLFSFLTMAQGGVAGTVVMTTNAVVFLLIHSVAAGGGR
jgi:maltodextrin utilization protein YvdJ